MRFMQLNWRLIGQGTKYADRLPALRIANFVLEPDGTSVLPYKGDLLHLKISGSAETVWFKCRGRRFDFTPADGPVLTIDLELG
jgi:hypothetical protein